MRQTEFTIAGMVCGGCVSAVRRALSAVPGTCVDDVSVGSAHVSYDASTTSPSAIAEAIGNAGYQVRAEHMSGAHAWSLGSGV